MPHSTQNSVDSARTFDLSKPDEPPDTPPPADTMKSQSQTHLRGSSKTYGVAVTSSPVNNARAMLPSQQKPAQQPHRPQSTTGDLKKLRRRSTPGTADDYAAADVLAQREDLDRLAQQQARRPASNITDGRSSSYSDTSKQRTQYYEEQFQYKENHLTQTREKVQRQTPVIAELKTNVIIKDEFTLVTDLSYQLAQRYTRPDSCIMIKVDHSACLAMGGTFDPCYILTINAVTSQMGPSTNKRNAALIQAFMADILSVPPERGIIKFVPIPEENLATGGNTILGEMEKAEKQERGNSKRTIDNAARNSMTLNKKSMPKLDAGANGNGQSNGTPIGTPIEKMSSQESSEESQAERPKTTHGTSNPVNGLRMNPISASELRGTASPSPRLTNGRPRSVGAPVKASTPDHVKRAPVPSVPRQTPQHTSAQTRTQPTKAKSTTKLQNGGTPLAPRPVQVQPNAFTTSSIATPFSPSSTTTKIHSNSAQEKQSKAVYMDMVTALPIKPDHSSVSVFELDSTPRSNSCGDITTAANTAGKRRSFTINSAATSRYHEPLAPPPPLGLEETRSMSSRLSKRKSFMKMFKRESSVPAWYKQ